MRRGGLRAKLGAALGVAAVIASAGSGAWAVAVGSEATRPTLVTSLPAVHGDGPTEGTDNDPGGAGGVSVPEPAADRLAAFRAPLLGVPLPDLDPSLQRRGPRPTLTELLRYQYGVPALIFDPRAGDDDWRLARPNADAVRGFADEVSVGAGQILGVRLTGTDRSARLDVYRIGRGDGVRVLTVADVPIVQQPEATPRAGDGLVEELWPRTTTIRVPAGWASGVYLIKLTGNSGGQSYIPFIVRPATATALTVVLPITTYQAYNIYGGAHLYAWPGGPSPRAYEVSFNRPFEQEYGAGLFFRLDFPLIVWLENHGYRPSYIADVDLARFPLLVHGSKTLLFSGHGEYWARTARNNVEAAAADGTNLGFFGANQAFWQIRLAADSSGRANRTVICYKSAALDPLAARAPAEATVRFQDPPVSRPPSDFMGLQYAGVVDGLSPMVLGDGILAFDPDLGLLPGQQLPGLIADEVDGAPRGFNGLLLSQTPVRVHGRSEAATAAAALWIAPGGYRVFDAGTFDFSWGLDPRYAAALPGFPAAAYSRLTAEILAWLGARPTI